MNDIEELLSEYKADFEKSLRTFYIRKGWEDNAHKLLSSIRYSTLDGGKRLRPILVRLGAEFAGKSRSKEYAINETMSELPYMASLQLAAEFIHCYSLVHDDLPCMDNDTLRRGKPTTHVKFDETIAVLTGDALLNLAYECLFDYGHTLGALFWENPNAIQQMEKYRDSAAELARAAGASGMIWGQFLDLENEKVNNLLVEDVIDVYRHKTCALLTASAVSGAIFNGAVGQKLDDLRRFMYYFGLIFQITDDILDITSTEEVLGKNIMSDSQQGKFTYVTARGLEGAKADVEEYKIKAAAIMGPYGEKAKNLLNLLEYICRRLY